MSGQTQVEEVQPEELKRRIDDGEDVFVLDVRRQSEFEEWHIQGESADVVQAPQMDVVRNPDAVLNGHAEDREVVTVCAHGNSSRQAAVALERAGYDAVSLADGMAGWATIYEAEEVDRYDGSGTLVQYQRPSSGCLSYLVHDGDEAAVVDPLRAFADRYLADAEELGVELTYAIDTHVHADHLSGVRALDDEGVEGVVPEEAVGRGVTYADELTTAADGDTFQVGDATIETVHTPGHTTGMTSYLVDDEALLTGDGLFVESVARPDLEKGDDGAPEAAEMLYESLQEEVLSLDDDVVVGGAHFSDAAEAAEDGTYTETIGTLVEEMDALTMDEDEFVDLILADMPPRPANYEDIIATNLGQQSLTDHQAFELELGPNNCAASEESLTGD